MNKSWHYGLVVLFSVIWSSAFIAGRFAIADYGPLTTLTIRFVISAIMLLPFCLLQTTRLFERRAIVNGLWLGVLNNAIYLGLTFSALKFISPALVVVIVSCAPFLTMMLTMSLGLERIGLRQASGILCAFFGVIIISGWRSEMHSSLTGIILAVLGTLAFSIGTVLFRSNTQGLRARDLNFWQSIAGVVLLLPISAILESAPERLSISSTLAVLWLAIVVTMGGMALWFWLIRTDGAAIASSYHLMNPFFGLLLSHFLLNTELKAEDFAGASLIALGLLLTMRKTERGNINGKTTSPAKR
ncbi:DMT family transporter [Brenneria tiliae]|uniref:DMT family transporter n=1 Tax=Brenneria tiliae TaxID=2914984 RepID=A0ABT0MNI5_9GAMM|nr:DMT family transporter [Brenneria tiliae]MCL2891399.1 DMT family transporter [Brenneria tiliae]